MFVCVYMSAFYLVNFLGPKILSIACTCECVNEYRWRWGWKCLYRGGLDHFRRGPTTHQCNRAGVTGREEPARRRVAISIVTERNEFHLNYNK